MKPKKNKQNTTTSVVRAAMKDTAKNVRSPKVVRNGKVKPQLNETNTQIDRIIINYDLIFKNKHLLNSPTFSSNSEFISVPSSAKGFGAERIKVKSNIETVIVKFIPKNKKLQKLQELFLENKPFDFLATYKNGTKILANGFITEIKSDFDSEEYSFSFIPNRFKFI